MAPVLSAKKKKNVEPEADLQVAKPKVAATKSKEEKAAAVPVVEQVLEPFKLRRVDSFSRVSSLRSLVESDALSSLGLAREFKP
eukprot:1178211-Prorocentrum_minimum.AAC.7